jgi:hypothetical protein
MLSQLLILTLRERFPDRGLATAQPPEACAVFPGIHPGIRRVSIYDDGDELTLCVDDLTHGHFADYTAGHSDTERTNIIVESVVDFLDALFTDQVVVWNHPGRGSGWFRIDLGESNSQAGDHEFLWSGPRTPMPRTPMQTKPRPSREPA